ncbi:hypothetical protein KK137_06315 [Croceibacterium sp. LX-88]|uniref:Uncharacterized protein n=1 Tax=Croceibacterium selenioxidans TaxID=2838833 RepID=A0ABS5W2G0_9SPHN|nr:hypothetical protein [Croceibacterium selenioxidans]MBT2133943.1 hypothetical protein [Croceibacterium selenioxidans]
MARKPGLLAKIDDARTSYWIDSLDPRERPQDSVEEILNPGRRQIARLTDEELAELLARGERTKDGQLAASEMRRRESWRTPARWAVIISLASFLVALTALLRTM